MSSKALRISAVVIWIISGLYLIYVIFLMVVDFQWVGLFWMLVGLIWASIRPSQLDRS